MICFVQPLWYFLLFDEINMNKKEKLYEQTKTLLEQFESTVTSEEEKKLAQVFRAEFESLRFCTSSVREQRLRQKFLYEKLRIFALQARSIVEMFQFVGSRGRGKKGLPPVFPVRRTKNEQLIAYYERLHQEFAHCFHEKIIQVLFTAGDSSLQNFYDFLDEYKKLQTQKTSFSDYQKLLLLRKQLLEKVSKV